MEPDLAHRLDKFGAPYTRLVESTLLRDLMGWVAFEIPHQSLLDLPEAIAP